MVKQVILIILCMVILAGCNSVTRDEIDFITDACAKNGGVNIYWNPFFTTKVTTYGDVTCNNGKKFNGEDYRLNMIIDKNKNKKSD